jgi:hypothetical protein
MAAKTKSIKVGQDHERVRLHPTEFIKSSDHHFSFRLQHRRSSLTKILPVLPLTSPKFPTQPNMHFSYLTAILPLVSLVAARHLTARDLPSIVGGDPQCTDDDSVVEIDCINAFAGSPLGQIRNADPGATIFIPADGIGFTFGTCDINIQFFQGDNGVDTTVDLISLSGAAQNLLRGTGGVCQVTLTDADNTLDGIASQFNPATL